MAAVDYKVWILCIIIITKTSAGAVTSFIPTLVGTLEYSSVNTLLLVAPPYVFATVVALAVSYNSDRTEERSFHIIVPIFFGMIGFIIAASTLNFTARYISLFLMLAGVYGSYNVALAWISSTLPRPMEKRAAAIAMVNTIGNMAQIYSPYLYPKSNGPQYLTAMITNAFFCLACVVATILLRFCLARENSKLAALEVDAHLTLQAAEKEKVEEIVDVDGPGGVLVLAPGFRYIL